MAVDPTTPTVGKLLDATVGRDAIHFALAPVVAEERLRPGQHIGFAREGDTTYVVAATNDDMPPRTTAGMPRVAALGIVDPFLPESVSPGQRFWMFLFPNTITGLRHVWSHPAFVTRVPGKDGGA